MLRVAQTLNSLDCTLGETFVVCELLLNENDLKKNQHMAPPKGGPSRPWLQLDFLWHAIALGMLDPEAEPLCKEARPSWMS